MATLSLSSRLVTNPAGQPRPGQGCRCIVHAVVGGEGGDQRLPARPDRRPCHSLRESAGSGGPPTPSSSLRYCGQDAASRRRLCHMPTTLRYIFLPNLPCSTAPAPFVWILFVAYQPCVIRLSPTLTWTESRYRSFPRMLQSCDDL